MSENPELPVTENSDSLISGTSALPYLQFASILLKGLEKLADIQKSTLDLYDKCAKDTGEATASMKEMFPAVPVPLFEMAEEAIRAFLQIQVHILDLMLKQSTAQIEALGASGTLDYDREIARLMRSSADCMLEMQAKAVDYIIQQNQSLAAELSTQLKSGATDETTDAIIQAQKRFWDVTLKPFKAWHAKASPSFAHVTPGTPALPGGQRVLGE